MPKRTILMLVDAGWRIAVAAAITFGLVFLVTRLLG